MGSNQVMEVPVGAQPWGLAAGVGFLWVADVADQEVWRLDPETGKPTAKIPLIERTSGEGPTDVAEVDASVWVSVE